MDLMKIKEMFGRDFAALQQLEMAKITAKLDRISNIPEPYDAKALELIRVEIASLKDLHKFYAQKQMEMLDEIIEKMSAVVADKANQKEAK